MNDTTLRSLVWLARRARHLHDPFPKPGALVVLVTGLRREIDPDAIGLLVGYGPAPYDERCGACGLPFDGAPGRFTPETFQPDLRDRYVTAVTCNRCGASSGARDVYDVRPLSGRGTGGVQRWENAEFVGLPASFTRVRPPA